EVKLLHLRCRYKQCAARSLEILGKFDNQVRSYLTALHAEWLIRNPIQLHKVHEAYFQYYVAASYENLGRASHNFSGNKIPLLRIAMDNYITCKTSLENAFTDPERDEEVEMFPEFHPVRRHPTDGIYAAKREYIFYQSARENSRSPALFQVRCCDEPGLTRARFSESNGGNRCMDLKADLIPLPLQIRKNRKDIMPEDNQPYKNPFASFARPLPEPPVSISVSPAPEIINGTIEFTPPSTPKSIDKPLKKDSLNPTPRMMSIIASLSAQIDENIRELSSLISKTTELQRIHKARKMNRLASYWSFTPTYSNGASTANGTSEAHDVYGNSYVNGSTGGTSSSSDEGKEQRIARLRAEGWNTVGIKSVERGWKGTLHYDRICSEALSELYET
ncbi:hypothetical protein FQN49_002960, partial [Arthroderma sp. PD_2]